MENEFIVMLMSNYNEFIAHAYAVPVDLMCGETLIQ